MEGKFLGLGLSNILILCLFNVAFIVIMKTVLNQYEVPGLTNVINAV